MAAAPGAGAELKLEQRSREEIDSFMEETKGDLCCSGVYYRALGSSGKKSRLSL